MTITTDEKLETIEKSQMSKIRVNPATLNTLPEFAGEVGLIKSLQTFPGIKTHSDGSAFFFVRGGNKDQNLILIDEAPVYNPAHLFGYYSVIIPDVAKEINIYKADMPIEKGDRLSSVIDVQTKDGNLRNFGMTGVLNPLIHRFAIEAPIVKENFVFASYRHPISVGSISLPTLMPHFSYLTPIC
ncbi:MAG: Plug domain-containing protein [Bacteroidales bacterium]